MTIAPWASEIPPFLLTLCREEAPISLRSLIPHSEYNDIYRFSLLYFFPLCLQQHHASPGQRILTLNHCYVQGPLWHYFWSHRALPFSSGPCPHLCGLVPIKDLPGQSDIVIPSLGSLSQSQLTKAPHFSLF